MAQETPADPTVQTNRLPDVVVTAGRLPETTIPAEKFPANVTVLDAAAIAASPAFTLPELLRQQVGFTPLDTVGFGSQTAGFSLRGHAEKAGTLILIDGVRVNDAGDGFFLWGSMPLENIERIEILRGGASTTYGEGAIGGVINIITKDAAARPFALKVSAAAGNLGYYAGHLEASGRTNWMSYYVSVDRQEWAGWRDFSSFRGWTLTAKPSVETPAGTFTFGYYYHTDENENPGPLTRAQFDANPRQRGNRPVTFENVQHRFTVDYAKSLESGWTVLGQVFGQLADGQNLGVTALDRTFVDNDQPNLGATLQASMVSEPFGRPNTLTFGGEAVSQKFRSDLDYNHTLFGPFNSTVVADSTTWSGFVQDRFEFAPRLALETGVRFDHRDWDIVSLSTFSPDIRTEREADVWSPKAALTAQLREKTFGWVSWSRAFRLPTGFDFGLPGPAPGQLFYTNPDIEPVDARTLEVGLRSQECRWLGGSATWFYSQVQNDIFYDPLAFSNANFDSIRQGLELSLNSKPAAACDLFFNAAYVDARFDGGAYDGNRLTLVPKWQLNGGVTLTLCRNAKWTLEAVHVNGQVPINDVANAFPRNTYTVLNTRVNVQWKKLTAFVAVNNLLDARYQQFPAATTFPPLARGFNPAPGINFQVGLGAAF
jgi:iron complex outermembrane receptor protein